MASPTVFIHYVRAARAEAAYELGKRFEEFGYKAVITSGAAEVVELPDFGSIGWGAAMIFLQDQSSTLPIPLKMLAHAEGLPLPAYETSGAAGMDLRAAIPEDAPIIMLPGDIAIVPTGVTAALPVGAEIQVRPRSGLAAKYGITVLNSPGTVDSDYRGEIKVILINHGNDEFHIGRGDRIAQMVFGSYVRVRFKPVAELDETARGEGGFGSTGIS